jgi:lipid-A-disaccharide synthase
VSDQQTGSSSKPIVLFTAFEPSGDALAAPVIAEMLRLIPDLRIYAYGGPLMREAGANMIDETVEDAAMSLGAIRKVFKVRKQIGALKRWSRGARVVLHVPVDSPAANFPICKMLRKQGARTVHLAAPQLWAWGRWRLGKLRKRTDLLLCLLPFEEQWFGDRKIDARFIGHPAVNREINIEELKEHMHGLPQGAPRVGIFPGSRPQEVAANIGLLRATFDELQGRYSGMSGVIVAANDRIAQQLRKKIKVFPTGMHMITGQRDAVIAWCDVALAVSGTISLHIARQGKPMVGVYKVGIISWLLSKLLLRTPFRFLPNIVAEREVVPEFVPHAGGAGPIIKAASAPLQDSREGALQTEELRRVCLRYANKQPAREAAKHILLTLKGATKKPDAPMPTAAHG